MKISALLTALVSVLMPVITQKSGLSEKHSFTMKMLCACMYLFTGVLSVLSVKSSTEYSYMILTALALGFSGDFFLSYKGDKYFPVGVVFFALGHISYSLTFLFIGEYKASAQLTAVLLTTAVITALIFVFAKTRLKLKGKKNLLLIYAPVLIFAFVCALASGAVAVNSGNLPLGLCLMTGGTLFFASDIMIGIGKGGLSRPAFLHNAVSYTYFTAQTLFAVSICFQ